MADWTGVLQLAVEKAREKTIAKRIFFEGAFKVMRPIYHQKEMPCYYLLNPGGGYLDGDTYKMDIEVGEDAQLTLTTQSAAKVYKTPKKYVYQEMSFNLAKNSYLEYIPDALIAYRDARYFQKTTIHMEQGATLLFSDILTPGWSPDGSFFSYDWLRLKNEIYYEGDLVAFDHIRLEPAKQNVDTLGFMEGYTHLGSFFVIGNQTNDALLDELYAILEGEKDVKIGLSHLAIPGFTIRILANKTQTIERIFTKCHHIMTQMWFNREPSFLRKY